MNQKAIPFQAQGAMGAVADRGALHAAADGAGAGGSGSGTDYGRFASAQTGGSAGWGLSRVWAPHYYDATTLMQPRLDPLL